METKSSTAKFELESADCQQESSVLGQTSVRNSFLDVTNISIPEVRSHPSSFRLSPIDCSSSENNFKYSECSQFFNPLYLASPKRSHSSQITNATLNKRYSSVSSGSNSFGGFIKTKQLQLKHTQRRPVSKKFDVLKNMLEMRTSSDSSSGKLYNLLPITRRSETSSKYCDIAKCRGDNEVEIENVKNEFSFRIHLQDTSCKSMISSSLPSTSALNKLESRYKKRHILEEVGDTGSAKKMKEDEPMEESFEGMDIDMAESFRNDQYRANENVKDEYNLSGSESSKENISISPACHRSHSSNFLGISEIKKSGSTPFFLEVQYELDIIKNPDVPSSAFACISAKTLAELLMSMTMEQFLQRFILIDCRYPFEFLGGHIRGAYNLFDPAAVEAAFYPNNIEQRAQLMTKKLIFYCEFSQKRAPSIAYELRALDRKLNVGRYPMVDYPEMYLLQYGYSSFYLRYNEVPNLLEPNGYVKMNDTEHLDELRNYKFHRIRTVATVYHTLARDRSNKQSREELNMSTTEVDPIMTTPPPCGLLPKRLFLNSPESPSHFPITPKSRPVEDRRRGAVSRSVCRRLFDEAEFRKNDPTPGLGTRDTL
uniref:protein-tyrosine-phosphatase n=1 Tax=Onchocerca volvulus TaxID=6282 RepID=A0A8R1TX93_ONCVO